MKLKFVLLALVGAAGTMASLALADSGHKGREQATKDRQCTRAVVFGTAAAPQSFTVTVTHAGRDSQFKQGDVVTVALGTQGQKVAITGFGCATGSTLNAGLASLRVLEPRHPETTTNGKTGDGHHGGATTTATTTTSDATTTTTAQTTTNGL